MTDIDTDTIPDEVWEQEVANGGAIGGELPRAALPTIPQGVTAVRVAPTLRHTSGAVQLPQVGPNVVPFQLGREPRRRRLLVSVIATSPAYVVLGDTREQAAAGYGLAVPAGAVLALHTAETVYAVASGGPATFTWLSELDQG